MPHSQAIVTKASHIEVLLAVALHHNYIVNTVPPYYLGNPSKLRSGYLGHIRTQSSTQPFTG